MTNSRYGKVLYVNQSYGGLFLHFTYLDYFILLLMLLSLWTGFRLGFFRALGGIASILLGLLLALIFSDDAANYLEQQYGLITLATEKINDLLPEQLLTASNTLSSLTGADIAIGQLPYKAAEIFLLVICFILIMFLVKLAGNILFASLHHLVEGNFLGSLDSVLGSLLVLAKNLLILILIFGLLTPVLEITAAMGWQGSISLLNTISSSFFSGYLYAGFEFFKNLL